MIAAGLPSGTVTFLFTDVEGSTRLLHELGAEAYAEALADHRQVIRAACAAHDGVEVDTQGDAFFFAFPTAPGALAAAEAFSAGLAANGPIRVRVGLHTGTPLLGEEGYVGHDVHRAARIAAAGHGGQVLVSASTAPLVEVDLRDLGKHRFKDLGAPERVFQLGDGDFPSLRSLYRTNLPVPATPFLGREQELAEVAALVAREDARIVTLTGPGGTGKTRLALQAAAETSDRFPDGVIWIPLAPLRDAVLLGTTFAQALEVSEQPGVPIADSIVSALVAKRAVVVVDNCEHLVDAVADLVRRLVEGCPTLVIVASSRERLGLRAERVYAVPPMAPTDGELLFAERARAVDSGFEPDEHVAAICEAVDGLPLAIELAAARVRALSAQAIRERLSERLSILSTRDRDVEERQRTLEATIAWSYDLLDAEEQRVLRALSVFAGGCTLAAAEAVAGADLDLLESLLDKSLLRHRIDEAGQDRYWMLETIREYGAARLAANGEMREAAARHLACFVRRAAEIAPPQPGDARGHIDADAIRSFEADRANFRVAILTALGNAEASPALRLAACLGPLWYELQELADSLEIMCAALTLPGGELGDRSSALHWAFSVATDIDELDLAQHLLDEAENVVQTGDPIRRYRVLMDRAYLALARGEFDAGIGSAEGALEAARTSGIGVLEMNAVGQLGALVRFAATSGESPDRELLERCRVLCQTGLDRARHDGSASDESGFLSDLAEVHLALGDYERAMECRLASLRLEVSLGRRWILQDLWGVATLDGLRGQYERASRLVGYTLHALDEQRMPVDSDESQFRTVEQGARAALGDEAYEAAVRAGEVMTLDEAVELALSLEASEPA